MKRMDSRHRWAQVYHNVIECLASKKKKKQQQQKSIDIKKRQRNKKDNIDLNNIELKTNHKHSQNNIEPWQQKRAIEELGNNNFDGIE